MQCTGSPAGATTIQGALRNQGKCGGLRVRDGQCAACDVTRVFELPAATPTVISPVVCTPGTVCGGTQGGSPWIADPPPGGEPV